MGVDTSGWIEIRSLDEWIGVMCVNWPFQSGSNRSIRYQLYDLATEVISPEEASVRARDDFGVNRFPGKPHVITWEKMNLIEWEDMDDEWYAIYDIMAIIVEMKGSENVRFVFWSG